MILVKATILAAALVVQLIDDAQLRLIDGTELTGRVTRVTHSVVTIDTGEAAEDVPLSSVIATSGWSFPSEHARSAELALLVSLRVRSGDTRGAALAAYELAPRVAGESSDVSSLVARALYRDALVDARPIDALIVSLIPGEWTLPDRKIDERYGLPVSAPPIPVRRPVFWSIDPSLVEGGLDERARLVLDLYTLARAPSADPDELEALVSRARRVNGDLGLEFLSHMLVAMHSADQDAVDTSVARLRSRAHSTQGSWTDAWARLAIASALLRTPDEERVSQALVELVSVSLHMSDTNPPLAHLARVLIEDTMLEHGRVEELRKFRNASAPGRPMTRKGR